MVRSLLRFGDCTLDIAARELRRVDVRVELSPTVFDCMAYLIERRERAVGRDELVAAVWGKTSISDTMLGKAILAIRRAVGDDAEQQALLRTVPRFGYHWVARVDTVAAPINDVAVDADAPLPSALSHSAPLPQAPTIAPPLRLDGHRQRLRRWAGPIALIALIAVVAGLLLRTRDDTAQPLLVATTTLPPDSCAILPAEIVADANDAWLRLGVMDLLATRLRGAGLPVLASDSIVRLAPEGTPTETATANLRRAADVQHLVQPAVRRSGASWIARVDLLAPDGARRAFQSEADNPIAAANAAADRLLAALGRASARPTQPAANLSLAELVQRVDAARLSDQLDDARALIAAAPAAQRDEPELRLRDIQIALRAGDLAGARERIARLLAQTTAEADPLLRGRALEALCVVHSRSGDLSGAMPVCDAAIDLLETQRDPIALGRAYNHRGIVHARELRRDAATADFARARVVLGTAGDPLLLAMVDGNESAFAMEQGRPADALPGIERAGRQFQRFGMLSEFAVAQVNLIEAHLALLQPLEALQASELGWPQRQRVGDAALRQRVRVERGEALAANGRLGEARSLFDEVLHGADANASRAEPALARAALARLDLAGGQFDVAERLAAQALPDLDAPEFTRQRALAWLVRQRSLLRLTRTAEASAAQTAFADWATTAVKPEARVLAAVAQAEIAAASGDATAVITAQRDAQQRAAAQQRSDIAAIAAASYGDWLLQRGDLREAAVVIGRLARHADADYEAALRQWRLYRALDQTDAAANVMTQLRRLAGERPLPNAEAVATTASTVATN